MQIAFFAGVGIEHMQMLIYETVDERRCDERDRRQTN